MTSAPLPRPLAADGAVTIGARTRELVVRPARDARGYAKVLWAEGVRAQAESAASIYGGAPAVWASGGGQSKVAYGLPAGDNALRFRFARGDPVYRKLVSTPGLRATFVVDRGSSHSRRQIPRAQGRGADTMTLPISLTVRLVTSRADRHIFPAACTRQSKAVEGEPFPLTDATRAHSPPLPAHARNGPSVSRCRRDVTLSQSATRTPNSDQSVGVR